MLNYCFNVNNVHATLKVLLRASLMPKEIFKDSEVTSGATA